jgi:hypothetical protein
MAEKSQWTSRDANFLRRFLESDTGVKLIETFKAFEPPLDEPTIEGRALQAAAFEQYRQDKDLIKGLMQVEKEPKEKPPYIDTSGLDVK